MSQPQLGFFTISKFQKSCGSQKIRCPTGFEVIQNKPEGIPNWLTSRRGGRIWTDDLPDSRQDTLARCLFIIKTLKVSSTSDIFNFTFFSNSGGTILKIFNMNHFPRYPCFCRFIPTRLMTVKPLYMVFTLTHVIPVKWNGIQYVDRIIHKNARPR